MSTDIAKAVQTAFLEATERLAEEGSSLTDLMVDSFKKDPLRTLSALSRFVPAKSLIAIDANTPTNIDVNLNIVRKAPNEAEVDEGLPGNIRVIRAQEAD